MIRKHHGIIPSIHSDAFIAESAVLIGDVTVGKDSSIWFGVVLRGDINYIKIGERTSIQDNTVVHVDSHLPVDIGDDVTIGHGAIIHGCTIENAVLIGMGAIILDGAKICSGSIVAAGAVVREGEKVPPKTLVAGIPAVPKKKLGEEVIKKIFKHAAKYADYAKTFISEE